MNKERTLTQNGPTAPSILLVLLSIGIVGVSIYLTNHFYATWFQSDLNTTSGICDINAFWSCDKATLSDLSQIKGVPVAILGMLFGVSLLIGSFVGGIKWEKNHKLISGINFVFCLGLFAYSLFNLGGLCPGCTIYYFLSAGVFYLFYKYGVEGWEVDLKTLALQAIPFILVVFFVQKKNSDRFANLDKVANNLYTQFSNLNSKGNPDFDSTMRLASATDSFEEAPIQISIFSDFQCPHCKTLADKIDPILEKFEGKINVQYFPYPLDSSCNDNLKSPFHPYACHAAYVVYCAGNKFKEAHDEVFDNVANLSHQYLDDLASKYGVLECTKSDATKEAVAKHISSGQKYNVTSTPTFIMNGRKLGTVPPTAQLIPFFKLLIEKGVK